MALAQAKAPTRERLLTATLELLDEGGYEAASVSAITGRAGVAAGTLYRHFASKEELFIELFRRVCSIEIDAMYEAASAEATPLVKLDAALACFAKRAMVRPQIAWALLAEPVDRLVDVERLEYRRRYRDLVAGLLDDAITLGELASCDTELRAAAIVGGVGEALVGPLAAGRSQTAKETTRLLTEIQAFVSAATGRQPTA